MLSKILRLFVNILTADDKYFLLNRDNSTQPIQILLSKKEDTFSQFFCAFLKSTLNFEHFRKKEDPHSQCILETTDSEKVWLHKCPKNSVSKETSTSNMVNGPIHCCNLGEGTFTLFIDHC